MKTLPHHIEPEQYHGNVEWRETGSIEGKVWWDEHRCYNDGGVYGYCPECIAFLAQNGQKVEEL